MKFDVQFTPNSSQPGSLPKPPEKSPGAPASRDTSLQYLLGKKWNEVNWNLAGAFVYETGLRLHLSMYDEFFGIPVAPVSLSGTLPCLWSLDWFEFSKMASPEKIQGQMKHYSDNRVPVFLNFDNPFMKESDLGDGMGNALVSFLAKFNSTGKNGVYVSNDALARHIKKTFPKLVVRSGLNRTVVEENRTADFYNGLTELYSCVAIHPVDALNDELLAGLKDKAKFEITVNDTCLDTCPCRKEHMELLSQIRREPWNIVLLSKRHQCLDKAKCQFIKRPEGSRALSLTYNEFEHLFSLGFRNFRLQAESIRNELTYMHYFVRWMYNNEDPEIQNRITVLYTTLLIRMENKPSKYPTGIKDYMDRKYD